MKKLSFLFSLFILLTAFTCENDSNDDTQDEEIETEDFDLIGTWKLVHTNQSSTIELTTQNSTEITEFYGTTTDSDYFITFDDVNYFFEGNYTSHTTTITNDGSETYTSHDFENVQGQGTYTVDDDEITTIGGFLNDNDDGNDTSVQVLNFEFFSEGQIIKLQSSTTETTNENDVEFTIINQSTSIWERLEVDQNACTEAIVSTFVAKGNFDLATDDNYTQLCNIYKSALENQIIICGDTDNELYDIIIGLGDCSVQQITNCNQLEAATVTAFNNFNEADSANYTELCNTYRTAILNQIQFCGDASGELHLMIELLGDCGFSNTESYVKLLINGEVKTFIYSPTGSTIDGNVFFNFSYENGTGSPFVYLTGVIEVLNQSGLNAIIYEDASGTEYFNYPQNYPFTNNLIQNDYNAVRGTIYGILQDDVNNSLELPLGIININY